jgi:large subunit ribosomal protein L6
MVTGVGTGFEKKLEIIGVGYKAQVKGKTLALNLGHSHPINFAIPAGIEIVPDDNSSTVCMPRRSWASAAMRLLVGTMT